MGNMDKNDNTEKRQQNYIEVMFLYYYKSEINSGKIHSVNPRATTKKIPLKINS